MLQLIVFDLDFCIWKPEMYQLRGPPTLTSLKSMQPKVPRKRKRIKQQNKLSLSSLKKPTTNRKGMIVTDAAGTPITVFEGASYALSEINKWKKQQQRSDCPATAGSSSERSNVQVAIASCTDEPGYARKCMDWLIVQDGSTLSSCFDHIEIRPGNKQQHFENLQRITGIPYDDMCFFDDYDVNIESVGSLGVKCFHTPHGMTKDIWNSALDVFELN